MTHCTLNSSCSCDLNFFTHSLSLSLWDVTWISPHLYYEKNDFLFNGFQPALPPIIKADLIELAPENICFRDLETRETEKKTHLNNSHSYDWNHVTRGGWNDNNTTTVYLSNRYTIQGSLVESFHRRGGRNKWTEKERERMNFDRTRKAQDPHSK